MTQTSDAARLDVLEARAQIADLVHRYARGVRTATTADCANLFFENATFEIREMIAGDPSTLKTRTVLKGRDAIVDYLAKGAAAGNCPLIHNLLIDVRGNEATSSAVMQTAVLGSAETLTGEYQDSFRKDGAWRFTGRIFTILRPRG